MTDEPIFTEDDFAQARDYEGLGPAYFAARRTCEGAMAAFKAEHVEPLIKEASDAFYERLMTSVQDYLWSNAEMNLQGEMYRMVDQTVKALLGGADWALQRYALGERYDCAGVRAAVAKHVPKELQDARIADLEEELKRLRSDLEWHRGR